MKNNKPYGFWTNYYENGKVSSLGKWEENGLDSIWVFYRIDGKKERSISYLNGLKNGRYTIYDTSETIVFDGNYLNDTLQGNYTLYAGGKLIEAGQYEKGILHGEWKEYDALSGRIIRIKTYDSGIELNQRKINQMRNGKKEGLWENFDKDGNLISAEDYTNGELYKDTLQQDIPFETQKLFFDNGQLKSRTIVIDGKMQGWQYNYDSTGRTLSTRLYRNDTLLSEGWFLSNGAKDSTWMHYYPTGELLAKGNYKNGKKEGIWTYYFINKTIEQRGSYKEDLPTGTWFWYYENGQIRTQESFYKGQYDGEVIDYDTSGKIIQKVSYQARELEGDYYYFIGDQQEKGRMHNGLRQGVWAYTYANGKTAFSGKYKDGVPDGKHKIWFENGRIAVIIRYKKGSLEGQMLEYWEQGGVKHEYYYKKNKLIYLDGVLLKD